MASEHHYKNDTVELHSGYKNDTVEVTSCSAICQMAYNSLWKVACHGNSNFSAMPFLLGYAANNVMDTPSSKAALYCLSKHEDDSEHVPKEENLKLKPKVERLEIFFSYFFWNMLVDCS